MYKGIMDLHLYYAIFYNPIDVGEESHYEIEDMSYNYLWLSLNQESRFIAYPNRLNLGVL